MATEWVRLPGVLVCDSVLLSPMLRPLELHRSTLESIAIGAARPRVGAEVTGIQAADRLAGACPIVTYGSIRPQAGFKDEQQP